MISDICKTILISTTCPALLWGPPSHPEIQQPAFL